MGSPARIAQISAMPTANTRERGEQHTGRPSIPDSCPPDQRQPVVGI